jgi:hypothetical protein
MTGGGHGWKSIRLLSPALLCAALGACSTTYREPVTEARQLAARLRVGDWVTCEMRNGTTRSFHVSEIRSDWLVGKAPNGGEQGVCLQDAKSIKVHRNMSDQDGEFIYFLLLAAGAR